MICVFCSNPLRCNAPSTCCLFDSCCSHRTGKLVHDRPLLTSSLLSRSLAGTERIFSQPTPLPSSAPNHGPIPSRAHFHLSLSPLSSTPVQGQPPRPCNATLSLSLPDPHLPSSPGLVPPHTKHLNTGIDHRKKRKKRKREALF